MYFKKFILVHPCRNQLYKCIISLVSSWHYPKMLTQVFSSFLFFYKEWHQIWLNIYELPPQSRVKIMGVYGRMQALLQNLSPSFPKWTPLRSTDVNVQRQLDTYWHWLLNLWDRTIQLNSRNFLFIIYRLIEFCFQTIVQSVVETLPVFLVVDCKLCLSFS